MTGDRKAALEHVWEEEVYPEIKRRLSVRDAWSQAEPDPRRELAVILHNIAVSMELAAQGRPFTRVDKCIFDVKRENWASHSKMRDDTGR